MHPRRAATLNRVVVIGGDGFVGSHVVRALVAAGSRPVVFGPAMDGDRLGDLASRFDRLEGSILAPDALGAVLADAEGVVSCAAHGGPHGLLRAGEADAQAAIAVNVTGLHVLLQAARAARVRRVVWTSSTVVYGPASSYPGPVNEGAAVAPTSLYGLTKAMAEQVSAYHRRAGLDVVALRLPLVLGPGLWYRGAAWGLASLFQQPAALAIDDVVLDLIGVADAAAAMLAVLRHPGPLAPVYNLAGVRARPSELVALIAQRRRGSPTRLDPAPSVPAPSIPLPLIDGARLRADTGFTAPPDLASFVDAMLEGPP